MNSADMSLLLAFVATYCPDLLERLGLVAPRTLRRRRPRASHPGTFSV